MKKILIIPDVHGRDFWKEAVAANDYEKVIFLGDYLDPYDQELIDSCPDMLEEIIKLKNNDPDKFVLLIGNHDRHYFLNASTKCSRFSHKTQAACWKKNLYGERTPMDIVHEETVNGRRFVFSHAGIHKEWYETFVEEKELDLDKIRKCYKEHPEFFDEILSYYRGGYYYGGSPTWADIREFSNGTEFAGVTQILGHTQLENDPINFRNEIYCLDVRRPFYIDENGDVCEMDGTIVKETKN